MKYSDASPGSSLPRPHLRNQQAFRTVSMDKVTIIDTIQSYINDQENFPVINPEAAKIQAEIMKPNPDLDAVKKLIRTDPTLTGEILKVSNSIYYKGLGEVSTIKEAALRLGQDEIFNLTMRVIHQKNFTSSLPPVKRLQKRLWNHSVACGFSTLWLAQHLKMSNLVPKAFIAGLLHDMGKLCLLSAAEKMLNEDSQFKLTQTLIDRLLESFHTTQGFALLKKWQLPDHYCRIARDHHAPEFDESDSLLLMVRLANLICSKLEAGDPEEDLSVIMGCREVDLLTIKETDVALLEIALEDRGLIADSLESRP